MKRDNNKNMLITDAESYRNTMMLAFYGLEDRIKKSKTAADYIDLIRRTGMLAEAMANVLAKLAENNETLKPIDSKTLDWIKKIGSSAVCVKNGNGISGTPVQSSPNPA